MDKNNCIFELENKNNKKIFLQLNDLLRLTYYVQTKKAIPELPKQWFLDNGFNHENFSLKG